MESNTQRRRKTTKWANRFKVTNSNPNPYPKALLHCNLEELDEEGNDDEIHNHGSSSGIETTTRDWSGLLDPFLLSIVGRLTTLQDFSAFRAACRNWRSLASPTPQTLASQSPLLLLTQTHYRSTKVFYDLTLRRFYYAPALPWDCHTRRTLGCSHGHLITATFPPRKRLLFYNIFTGDKIRVPTAPFGFHRVLLSSSPSTPGCLVLLLPSSSTFSPIRYLPYLWVGDARWSLLDLRWTSQEIVDVIFFEGRLYAQTMGGQLGIITIASDPELTLLEAGKASCVDMNLSARQWWCLAASGRDLLWVCACFELALRFYIWRWDFNGGGWGSVSDLGGRALFINHDGFVASVVPSSGSEVRKNCIYYAANRVCAWVVYSVADHMTIAKEHVPFVSGLQKEHPIWVLPSLC